MEVGCMRRGLHEARRRGGGMAFGLRRSLRRLATGSRVRKVGASCFSSAHRDDRDEDRNDQDRPSQNGRKISAVALLRNSSLDYGIFRRKQIAELIGESGECAANGWG